MRKLGTFLVCTVALTACESPGDGDFSELEQTELTQDARESLGSEHAATREVEAPQAAGPTTHGVVTIQDVFDIIDCFGSNRLIGVLDANPTHGCEVSGTAPPAPWVTYPLFEDGSPLLDWLDTNGFSVPGDLNRYCAYDFTSGAVSSPVDYQDILQYLEDHPDLQLTSVAADCRGEAPQASLYDSAVSTALELAFIENIDWDTGGAALGAGVGRTPIEVAVVDTVSQTAQLYPWIDPVDEHGLYMADIIEAIACPAGATNCGHDIYNVLAMPREDWGATPDWNTGGHHGTQGDLAMAVYEAVAFWRARRVTYPLTSSPRLVINLSVGWRRLAEITQETDRGPAYSLLSALDYAACQGAIVTASAGNITDEVCPNESDQEGPLAPAEYVDFVAPTAAECASMGFSPSWTVDYPVHDANAAPLVWAIGGVDEHDRPLPNARRKSTPRQVALGSNAIINQGVDTWREPLTGTSVSSAVAAGTAALLWSYRPALKPYEIMNLIYDSGWDTGYDADFPVVGSPPDVRRLSVCAALSTACVGQTNCPTNICTVAAQPANGNMAGFEAAVTGVLNANPAVVAIAETSSPGSCDSHIWTSLSDPQPEKPICGRCNIYVNPGANNDELNMTIDDSYYDQIDAAELTIYDGSGALISTFNFSNATLDSLNDQPNPALTQAIVETPGTTTAILEFTLKVTGETQANAVTVLQM